MFTPVDETGPEGLVEVGDLCPHGVPADLCADVCVADTGPRGSAVDLDQLPGARLALQCQAAGSAPDLLSDGEVLDVVAGAEKIIRWAAGLRARMTAEFADRQSTERDAGETPMARWLPDEIGLTLGISRLDGLAETARACRLAHVLPDTLAALEQGTIGVRSADAIAESTAVLPDESARAVESRVLPGAPDATLKQLRDRVRRAIVRVDPDGEYRRHRVANTERRVSIRSLDEGMASLWFYGPAEQVEAAWQMADRLARAPHDPADERTLDQRRFDIAVQLLQGTLTATDMTDVATATDEVLREPAGAETASSGDTTAATGDPAATEQNAPGGIPPDLLAEIVAQVLTRRPDPHSTVHKPLIHVVVGLDTLLGSDRPAELVGHGPVSAATARALAADGAWKRLVTDPLSGTLLDHGRTTYTPPAGLADHVRARDQVCRGPGCTRGIRDLDHHVPYGGGHDGRTGEENLYGLCMHCHKLKDAPGWHVLAHPDRTLTWISPHGRRITTAPYDYRPFTDEPAAVEPDSAAEPVPDPAAEADTPPPF